MHTLFLGLLKVCGILRIESINKQTTNKNKKDLHYVETNKK